jgi:5-methylcytosine-specific restriction endonuclease McrA
MNTKRPFPSVGSTSSTPVCALEIAPRAVAGALGHIPVSERLPSPGDLREEYTTSTSLAGLARKYGVAESSLRLFFKEHGIPTHGPMKRAKSKCIDCGRDLTNRKCSRCWSCYSANVRGALHPRTGKPSPWSTGDQHWNWKGGKSGDRRGRWTSAYTTWQLAVFKRDEHKCTMCGAVDQIVAHHIFPFNKYTSLRYCVSNGITLCRSCHPSINGREIEFSTLFNAYLLVVATGGSADLDFFVGLDLL